MKRVIAFVSLFCVSGFVFGQTLHQAESFELSTPVTGNQIYEASQYIKLLEPGFHYVPQANQTFIAKINPYLIFPPTGGETGGPNLEDDGVVGAINGILNISPSGAATYSIPIEIPSGINGMQPNLSLVYNSQSGNGFLGYGWALAGMSSISVIGKSIYHDGEVLLPYQVFKEQQKPNFAIDGQRLILINTDNTNQTLEFRTEVESFSKIICHFHKITVGGYYVYVYDWFEVFTKNGIIFEYGSTVDSRVIPDGCYSSNTWLLNKTTDQKGNYVKYAYYQNSQTHEFYPLNIEYTGNETTETAISPFYRIDFKVRSRDDKNTKYYNRVSNYNSTFYSDFITQNVALESIQLYDLNSSVLLKEYYLNYNLTPSLHLNSVSLKTATEKINTTKFYYGEEKPEISIQECPGIQNYYDDEQGRHYGFNKDRVYADYNGDGLTDVIIAYHYTYYDDDEEKWIHKYDKWKLFINKGKEFNFGYEFASEGTLKTLTYGGGHPCIVDFLDFTPCDFDGDGKIDIVIKYHYVNWSILGTNILHSTGNGFEESVVSPSMQFTDCLAADFDGDGRSELLYIDRNANPGIENIELIRFITNSNNNLTEKIISKFEFYVDISWQLLTNQMSGDGRSQLVITKGAFNQMYVYGFNKTNNDPEEYSMYYQAQSGFVNENTKEFWGEINGDGISDVLIWNRENESWSIGLFDGESFHQIPCPLTRNYSTEYPYDNVKIGDFNGDGKGDILLQYNISNPFPQVGEVSNNIYYFNGTTFQIETNNTIGYTDTTSMFLDFNGDGKDDIVGTPLGLLSPTRFMCFHANENANLIEEITTGFGVSTKLEYDQLTNKDLYTSYSNAVYPIIDMSGALTVVKKTSTEYGSAGYNSTSYKYVGAKAHLQGKGFLGFSEISVTDDARHTVSNTINNTNLTYFFLYPQSITQYYTFGSKNQILTSTTNNYTIKDFGNKRFFPYVNVSLTKAWDYSNVYLGTTKNIVTYNENDIIHGNVTSTKTLTDEDELEITAPDTDFAYCTSNEFLFEPIDEPNWIISRINSKTSKSSVPYPGSSEISRTTSYEYYLSGDIDYPLLKKTISFSGEQMIWEEYTYDGVGNIVRTKISAPNSSDPDITPRENNFEYSDIYSKRFLTKTYTKLSDAIILSTETTYYPETGLPKETTDANNHKTTYYYDSFNRMQKKVNPDGIMESTVLRWKTNETNLPDGTLFYSWTSISGSSPVITYYDKFSREIGVMTKAFDNTSVTTEKSYDKLGRLEYIYEPNDKTIFTQKKYNEFGQLQQVVNPDMTTTSYNYNGRTTITTNALFQTQTKNINPLGWMEECIDAKGQSIKYEYFADGQVHHTYLAGIAGSDIYNTYDPITGKPATTTDPDAGIIEYTYNPYGELIKQKQIQSATKTIEYTYKYDKLGRNIEKNNAEEGSTKTEYDTKEFGKGLVSKVENTALGNSIEYSYDPMSRISDQKETIDGVKYVTTIGYDIYGRQNKIDYPFVDGTQPILTVTKKYDNNGFLISISNETEQKVIWQLNEMNIKGQIKKYTLGNGLETKQDYYPLTGLPYKTKTFNITNNVQDLEYGWNNIGNLSYRKKWLNQAHTQYLNEEFTYDELSRLDITKLNGVQTSDMNYLPTGNIQSKTGLGLYSYAENGAGIHAITSVENTNNLISTESQTIVYTPFNKVNQISQGNHKTLNIWYGLDQQRIKQTSVINSVTKTKIYVGGLLERVSEPAGNVDYYFIATPTGISAVYVKPTGSAAYTRYIHTDHLGSLSCITNETGQLVFEYSFDAWGNRRDPATWQASIATLPILFCDRGFTGHEHLEAFGLINMNGRVYDPILGRLLSPDNYVQSPIFSQSFNRYSYCFNNPLNFTDPDGQNPLIAAAFIGGWINVFNHFGQIQNFGDFAAAFGIGALAGLSGGIAGGALVGVGFIGAAITAGMGYAASTGVSTSGNSAYFNDPVPSLRQFGIGMGISMLTGGVAGGISAVQYGGDFTTGEDISFGDNEGYIKLTPEKKDRVIENLKRYHSSDALLADKKKLVELVKSDPNIEAGYVKLGVSPSTDASLGNGFGYTDEGYIVTLKNGRISRAVTQFKGKVFADGPGPCDVFYSHGYLNADEMSYVFKQSTLVHELAHVYHWSNPALFIKQDKFYKFQYVFYYGSETCAYDAQNIYLANHGSLLSNQNPHPFFLNSAFNLPTWFPR